MKNELVILTSKGKIAISIDQMFQNMHGSIMYLHQGKHFNLREFLNFDFADDAEPVETTLEKIEFDEYLKMMFKETIIDEEE